MTLANFYIFSAIFISRHLTFSKLTSFTVDSSYITLSTMRWSIPRDGETWFCHGSQKSEVRISDKLLVSICQTYWMCTTLYGERMDGKWANLLVLNIIKTGWTASECSGFTHVWRGTEFTWWWKIHNFIWVGISDSIIFSTKRINGDKLGLDQLDWKMISFLKLQADPPRRMDVK